MRRRQFTDCLRRSFFSHAGRVEEAKAPADLFLSKDDEVPAVSAPAAERQEASISAAARISTNSFFMVSSFVITESPQTAAVPGTGTNAGTTGNGSAAWRILFGMIGFPEDSGIGTPETCRKHYIRFLI